MSACSCDSYKPPSNRDTDLGPDASSDAAVGSNRTDGGDGSIDPPPHGDAALDEDAGTGVALGIPDAGWEVPDALKLCGKVACQCANGIDDDGDGKADGFDTECIGPNDDDEASFATGISGDNQDPKWQDCFFDGNSGAGDDGCSYHTDCIYGIKTQDDPDCQVSQECIEFCSPRTPNGCDCFGCCDLVAPDGSTATVHISESCDAEDLSSCMACVKAEETCNNPCGECELCPGRTLQDLPESCFDTSGSGGTGGTGGDEGLQAGLVCDGGQTVCASSQDCGSFEYCSFGCCIPVTLE